MIGWWDAGAMTCMRDCEREGLDVLEVDERGRVGMIRSGGREMCVESCMILCNILKC